MTDRSWIFDAPARKAVEGGVVVGKPGHVAHDDARDLVAAAAMETEPKILARGRTYARKGQVVDVHSDEEGFTARIQGSAAEPYLVRLQRVRLSGSDRVAADCTCPHGCDLGWCKHAAALAFVAAFLLDNDAGVRSRWSGAEHEPGTEIAPLTPAELGILLAPAPAADPAALLVAADAIVPYPGAG